MWKKPGKGRSYRVPLGEKLPMEPPKTTEWVRQREMMGDRLLEDYGYVLPPSLEEMRGVVPTESLRTTFHPRPRSALSVATRLREAAELLEMESRPSPPPTPLSTEQRPPSPADYTPTLPQTPKISPNQSPGGGVDPGRCQSPSLLVLTISSQSPTDCVPEIPPIDGAGVGGAGLISSMGSVPMSPSTGAIKKVPRPPPVPKPITQAPRPPLVPKPAPQAPYISTPRNPTHNPTLRPPMPQPVPSPIPSLMSIRTSWSASWGLPPPPSSTPRAHSPPVNLPPRPATSIATLPVSSIPLTRPPGYPQTSPIPSGSPFLFVGCRKCGELDHDYKGCEIKMRRCFWCGRWGVDVTSCPVCSKLP